MSEAKKHSIFLAAHGRWIAAAAARPRNDEVDKLLGISVSNNTYFTGSLRSVQRIAWHLYARNETRLPALAVCRLGALSLKGSAMDAVSIIVGLVIFGLLIAYVPACEKV